MKGVPEAQQDQIIAAVEKNPELFQKIALETQERIKGGEDQMTAAMAVMQKYQAELKNAIN